MVKSYQEVKRWVKVDAIETVKVTYAEITTFHVFQVAGT